MSHLLAYGETKLAKFRKSELYRHMRSLDATPEEFQLMEQLSKGYHLMSVDEHGMYREFQIYVDCSQSLMTEHIGGDNQFEILSRGDGSLIESFNVWHIQYVYKRLALNVHSCFSVTISQTKHDFFPASDESRMEFFECLKTLFKFINRKFADIETLNQVPLMTHNDLVIEVSLKSR
jgi:hypothetical protein